jgi:hypothetical protein
MAWKKNSGLNSLEKKRGKRHFDKKKKEKEGAEDEFE